jgi:hypothetical protein
MHAASDAAREHGTRPRLFQCQPGYSVGENNGAYFTRPKYRSSQLRVSLTTSLSGMSCPVL